MSEKSDCSNNEPKKPIINIADWMKKIESSHFSRKHMDAIIMDYFVKGGFKEAAQIFQKESGAIPAVDLNTLDDNVKVRGCVESGNIKTAIEKVNELCPELFNNNKGLYFKLQLLPLIELIEKGKIEESIKFGENLMLEVDQSDKSMLNDFECVMALLAFDDPYSSPFAYLLQPSYRQQIACELNYAIMNSKIDPAIPKITVLMKLILWAQNELEKINVKVPHMTDFATAKIEFPE